MRLTDDPSVRALAAELEHQERERRATRQMTIAGIAAILQEDIIGQDAALEAVSVAMAAGLSGLGARDRGPVASLAFVGPTGSGKTETTRSLTRCQVDGVRPFIRLDMTEYSERTSLSRLVGSNRGYIGYGDRGSLLTAKVRAAPNAVVVFDEFEKAHPAVQDTLLQVFEEGALTDGAGATARFDRAIVVLTSNLGAREADRTPPGFRSSADPADRRSRTLHSVRRELRPELLGRLDALVVFDALSDAAIEKIARALLDAWSRKASSNGWHIEFDDDVVELLTRRMDRAAGARDLRRQIDAQLTQPLLMRQPGAHRASVVDGVARWDTATNPNANSDPKGTF